MAAAADSANAAAKWSPQEPVPPPRGGGTDLVGWVFALRRDVVHEFFGVGITPFDYKVRTG